MTKKIKLRGIKRDGFPPLKDVILRLLSYLSNKNSKKIKKNALHIT